MCSYHSWTIRNFTAFAIVLYKFTEKDLNNIIISINFRMVNNWVESKYFVFKYLHKSIMAVDKPDRFGGAARVSS